MYDVIITWIFIVKLNEIFDPVMVVLSLLQQFLTT